MTRNATLTVLVVTVAAAALLLPAPVAAAVGAAAVVAASMLPPREQPAPTPAPTTREVTSAPADVRPLLDGLREGVLLVDAQETVVLVNQAAAQILDRPREAMEGVSLIRATRQHELLQTLREAAGEARDLTLDDRVVQVAAYRLHDGHDGTVHTVLAIQDLTPLRRAERARVDLVANVSHELRTPIAAARAIAETLEDGVDEPEQRERFHRQLTVEVERLGDIVERLLRLSRLESRSEEFAVEALDPEALVAEAIEHMTPVARRADITFVSTSDLAPGTQVAADRERVIEVLTNLLDNAVRYSPPGIQVTVRLSPGDAEADTGGAEPALVRCCVHDQGSGILPADRQRIFERFYTADRARAGASTGLGLAIARHIVSRLGGAIWVADATPGATLCFTLPRAGAEAAPATTALH
ncbi:MAG: ATP-binding protein [Dehalococcoidia bacterium]